MPQWACSPSSLHIARPFRFVTVKFSNAFSKLLGFDPKGQEELVTEEEIRMMVDVGNEKGSSRKARREMINNIFEFDDTTAEEIMTHRTEISAVPIDSSLDEVLDVAITEGYSPNPGLSGRILTTLWGSSMSKTCSS